MDRQTDVAVLYDKKGVNQRPVLCNLPNTPPPLPTHTLWYVGFTLCWLWPIIYLLINNICAMVAGENGNCFPVGYWELVGEKVLLHTGCNFTDQHKRE